jgi:hypothetical protein
MSPRSFAIAASSMCIGLGVGYIVAERRLSAQFEERLERETAEMKSFYTAVKKKHATPEEAVKELIPEAEQKPRDNEKVAYHKVLKKEEYAPPATEEAVTVITDADVFEFTAVEQNIFDSKPPMGDQPYVISQEEFMQNDPDHNQGTLTYYTDDVLTDEREEIIDDVKRTVGEDCFGKFGQGSSDPNVVHVRNYRLGMDFEIVRSERTYEEDVLGMESSQVESVRDRIRRGE